jgi:hypothetical protein
MSNYIGAVIVTKALTTEVIIAQSQGAPIIVLASIITKYCPTAALWQEKLPTKSNSPISTNLATTHVPCNATNKRDHNTPKEVHLRNLASSKRRPAEPA